MNIVELTKKAVELASQDEKLKEKTKDTIVTIVMLCKNGGDQVFTFSVDKGQISFSEEKLENPDFQFEISKKDFFDLMTGKAYGMILMATKKMKMTKGTWAEIGKISTPLSVIPKIGKEIASKEKVDPV
ncbi:MAG: SCP2 sterol-binding domain-containing protein [Atribacterota bacterium]|nr:SCP2 sterol-binding domain-containing protein [Atribacterota bacterium]